MRICSISIQESDNELYNAGIVDKSHKYPKMYVVRPQFFILISLLRDTLKSLEVKNQLAAIKEQNVDVTNFEDRLDEFKKGFDRNCDLHFFCYRAN